MFKQIKNKIKGIVPRQGWKILHNMRHYANIIPLHREYLRKQSLIQQKKEPINVLFFSILDNQWKYDSVFKMMLNDSNFKPLIIVCPSITHDRKYMLDNMKRSCEYFKKKGYPFVCGYDENSDTCIDAHKYNPDIIFFCAPYPGATEEYFTQSKFEGILTCYVNYFYVTLNESWTCFDYHTKFWRYYLEYPKLLEQINNLYYPCKINGKVVGYPHFDAFRQHMLSVEDWPIAGKRKKRIIWAPHHTVSSNTGLYAMSTFERYSEFMLKIVEKYRDELEIVFKPHPALKPRLYNVKGWGKERTDAYYDKWATGENTAFVDGEYIGLFLASDAMIHDCNSFTVEYLAVNKPAMFLDSGMTDDKINEVGNEARACYYKGYCEEDIENFIKMIIEGGEDILRERREAFYKNYILPPNGKLAAENIIDDLLTSLGRK